jgi:hypothetical protein
LVKLGGVRVPAWLLNKETMATYKHTKLSKVITELSPPLPDLKKHLRVETDFIEDDAEIADIYLDVIEEAENILGWPLNKVVTTKDYYNFLGTGLILDFQNIQTVDSIHWYDEDDNETEITSYDVIKDDLRYVIDFGIAIDAFRVKVVFTSGYTAVSSIPRSIQRAIRLRVSSYYDIDRADRVFVSQKDTRRFEQILELHQTRSF